MSQNKVDTRLREKKSKHRGLEVNLFSIIFKLHVLSTVYKV